MDRNRLCLIYILIIHVGFSCVAVRFTTGKSGANITTSRPGMSRPLPDIPSLCPYNRYCKSPPLKNISDTRFTSCCQECFCDAGCHEIGNCCPDSPYTSAGNLDYPCKNLVEIANPKMNKSDGISYTDSSVWYHVIDNCKDKLMELIHPRCSKPTELEDLVVVSNKKNGRVYKNKHCALCNGEQNYTDWVLKVVCTETFLHSFQSVEEKNRYMFENRDKCPIYSVSPDYISEEELRCFPEPQVKSVCNITGLWDFYDKDIEDACLQNRNNQNVIYSLDEELLSIVTVKYSNVYCYLCNTPGNKEKKDLCKHDNHRALRSGIFLQFSAIIDLRHNERAVQVSPCQPSEMWDQFGRVCRQLLCPEGTIPSYGSCDSVVTRSNDYPIALKFELDYDSQMLVPSEELMRRLAGNVVPRLGSGCGISTTSLTSTIDLTNLYFELIIYSTDTCSVETMLTNTRILAISKELRLKYRNGKKEIQISLRLNLDKDLNLGEVIAHKSFVESIGRRDIDSSILYYCPRITLTPHELNSYNIRSNFNTTKVDLENGTSTQSKSICIDEYFRIRQELSGTVSNHRMRQFMFFVFEIFVTLFCFI